MILTIVMFGIALYLNCCKYGINLNGDKSYLISTIAIVLGFLSIVFTLFMSMQSFVNARYREVEVLNIEEPNNIQCQINKKIDELRTRNPKRYPINVQVEYEENKIIIFYE